LIGADALPDDQRLTLLTARLLKEGFLQQNALHEIDTYCSVEKQVRLLGLILDFHQRASALIEAGCPIVVIQDQPAIGQMLRLKETVPNDDLSRIIEVRQLMFEQMDRLMDTYAR
jgi:V/A-type H+-transporting ATPase subunit A